VIRNKLEKLVLHGSVAVFLAATTAAFSSSAAKSREPQNIPVSGDIEPVHDPAIIQANGAYYLFATGGFPDRGFIPIRRSRDLRNWRACGYVFSRMPAWAHAEIPMAHDLWAPDISRERGEYRLYYAVSSFGKNDSAIGLAINKTLDPGSPEYQWIDRGIVLRSHARKDDWNAIDPNLVRDKSGNLWLDFGSFWGGIKMRRVDPETGLLSDSDRTLYSLAARPRQAGQSPAVEAPFLVYHRRHYYLFVSFDFCCRGAQSTYYVAVGRSRKIEGPYVDGTGRSMMDGGGTRICWPTTEWRGPGHEAVLADRGGDYLIFHAYSAVTGRPSLHISTIVWRNGWPELAPLPGTRTDFAPSHH
jgi:arabinan endo-1,5-alpha-L-arabinosidase